MFKNKIQVDVINEAGLKRKKYPIEGNSIIIRAGKRGRGGAGYSATFDKYCLLPYYVGLGPFKRLKQKLILIEGASECVSFKFDKKKAKVKKPSWNRKGLENASKATVIKAAGASFQKLRIPALLYIALFMLIGLEFLSILILSGRVVI